MTSCARRSSAFFLAGVCHFVCISRMTLPGCRLAFFRRGRLLEAADMRPVVRGGRRRQHSVSLNLLFIQRKFPRKQMHKVLPNLGPFTNHARVPKRVRLHRNAAIQNQPSKPSMNRIQCSPPPLRCSRLQPLVQKPVWAHSAQAQSSAPQSLQRVPRLFRTGPRFKYHTPSSRARCRW